MNFEDHIDDACFIVGAAVVAVGVGLIYFPAGLVVAGLATLAFGYLVARAQG
jgi:hypothetical protein